MEKQQENIWNVPNVLTMLRMLLIPVYWVVFLSGHKYRALAVFLAASLTDLMDGYIARRFSLITNFGKIMDPAADKLMAFSVMLSWVIEGDVPWPAAAILLAKELTMGIGGMVLLKYHVVSYAKPIGKAAQTLMVCSLVLCFFGDWFMEHVGFPVHLFLLWCAVALTLCALAYYVRLGLKWYHEAKGGRA